MDHRHELTPGTVLDRKYRIDRVLGIGGFGVTYAAFDLGLATDVAVKEYYPTQFAFRDSTLSVRPASASDRPLFERMRTSFLREARTLAQFDHPGIVRVLNVFEAHGTAYMVMRLENGPSLKSWRTALGHPPAPEAIRRIAARLLDAVEVMHDAAFLHRDIAPDNVIIRSDGSPVVLDFGATRRMLGQMTSNVTNVVKRGYSPQEQYSADGRGQGPWTDIYSLAGTLYYAITGKQPADATERILDDRQPALSHSVQGDYGEGFLAAIDWGLQLRPNQRPQSLAAWRERMFPVEAATQLASARGTDTAASGSRARSARVAVAATAGVLLLVLAGGLMLRAAGLLRGSQPPIDVSLARRDDIAAADEARRSADRLAAEAAAKAAREEADRIAAAAVEADLKAREEAARIAAAEAEAKRKREEAASIAAAEAEAKRKRDEAARIAAAEAEAKRKREEAARLAAAEAEAKHKRDEAARIAAAEAEAKRKREEAARVAAAEAEAKRKRDEAARIAATAETEAKRQREEADAKARAREEQPKSTPNRSVLIASIRSHLKRVGCETQASAPDWTTEDQKALERFVKYAGAPFTFRELNDEIAEAVGSYVGRVCPAECGAGETPADNRCVAAGELVSPARCDQINERAQIGILTAEDRDTLRSGRCRK